MAPPAGTLRVGRYFLALLLLVVALYSLIVFPGQRHTPKLGIDLVGGLRVVFTAITPDGAPPPNSSQMSQARQILEDRINTYGVTGATVVVQGGNQLVIEIPNGTGADVERLGKAAVLNFRGVMAPAQQVACVGHSKNGGAEFQFPASTTVTTSTVASAFADAKVTLTGTPKAVTASGKSYVTANVANTSSALLTSARVKTITAALAKSLAVKSTDIKSGPLCASDPFFAVVNDPSKTAQEKQALTLLLEPSLVKKQVGLNAESCPSPAMPKVNSSDSQPAECKGFSGTKAALTAAQQQEVTAALQTFDCSTADTEADIPYNYYIACDSTNAAAFLLGHVVVKGQQIGSATAQAPDISGNGGSSEWTVRLKLHGSGANNWHDWTSKFHTDQSGSPVQTSSTPPCGAGQALPCSDWVAFTLDGQALSTPITQGVLDVNTEIHGGFTQSTANDLARELNYGKLPLNFHAEENNKVSATLGDKQLRAAFLAGGIGLALVILYSMLYYRALGLVTIASLVVSGTLTYAMLVILSKQIGFTLDLAGIAGFIVALGITADSFVVFFERIKDEVHEGRSLRVAVPRAWVRARRTILSADTVSFLAAAILYYFASADVKGFAFTLGMSTILDLVVVFLFTHPMVSLLSRSKSFGSARFSGLAAVRVGGIAISDDEPEPVRRRPARTRRPTPDDGGQAAAVAVLDEEAPADEAEPPVADEAEEPQGERRRTTPEAGSAAERAARRRARMREQSDGEGNR